MAKLRVYPVTTKRNKEGQLVLSTTVSRAIEDRLQKLADEAGVSLEEFIQESLAMVAKCEPDDKGELKHRGRKHLLPERVNDPKVRSYKCPHCTNSVFRSPKDYGKADESLVKMRDFCIEEGLTGEIEDYLSAVCKNSNALLSLLGTSDGLLKAAAKVDGVNYYKREDLEAYVIPKLNEVRASIQRIKQEKAAVRARLS